jgi:competence protein ComEC
VGVRAVFYSALVAAALFLSWLQQSRAPVVTESRTTRFDGTFLDARASEAQHQTFTFLIKNGPLALVTVANAPPVGTRTIVRGRLEPLDEARNPGETSERAIEAEHGITARIESATVIATIGPSTQFRATLARLRARAHETIASYLGEPDASIVAGELWGERAHLPPDLKSEFQETGTVHVLVTAGLHVGLVAVLVAGLCTFCGVPRGAASVAGIVAVWAFAAFSGLDLPALRAATMLTVALIARACGRSAISWQTLIVAASVVVAVIPGSIASPSFWLSFCCVASIFALARHIDTALEHASRIPHAAREALGLTIATQLGTWPIIASMFEQYSTYAVLANLAVVPCVPATMILGALTLAFSRVPPLAQACANLDAWIVAWVVGVVHVVAGLPGSSIVTTPAPTWIIAVYECSLFIAAWLIGRKGVTPAAALVLTATSLVLWPPHALRGPLKITVLDVGQADSIVIETPAHHAILVDAGGRLERGPIGDESEAERVGERIVVPFLIREGIHELDAIVISHPHGDHVGGCAPVLRKIRVDEIADSGQTYGGHAYHDCLDVAHTEGVPIVHPRAGTVWQTNDGVTLYFIGPQLPFIGGRNAINDNSIAFILRYKHFRMLFTGDAGSAAEQRFLAEGVDLHTEAIKVGHHGSAYGSSPEFIAAVYPRYAIISVGRHNLFGHPAPSTIETLRRFGATVYRTDSDGSVSLETDGKLGGHFSATGIRLSLSGF